MNKIFKITLLNIIIFLSLIVVLETSFFILRAIIGKTDVGWMYRPTSETNKILEEHKNELSSCTPSSLSASFIYYYIHLNDLDISKKDISDNTGISVVTIQKVVNIIINLYSTSFTVFLEVARTILSFGGVLLNEII